MTIGIVILRLIHSTPSIINKGYFLEYSFRVSNVSLMSNDDMCFAIRQKKCLPLKVQNGASNNLKKD